MQPPVSQSGPLFVAVALLVLLASFLAAAEAALLRVPRVRLEVAAEGGDRRAVRVLRLVEDLPRVLNSVLLTVLLVQVGLPRWSASSPSATSATPGSPWPR